MMNGKIEQVLWQRKTQRPAFEIYTTPLLFQNQILFTPLHKLGNKYDGIVSYNLKTDSYTLLTQYPEECNPVKGPSTCVDEHQKLLYIFEDSYTANIFYIYDLVNSKWYNVNKIISEKNSLKSIGENSTSTIINGKYHIIGGRHNEYHYTINTKPLMDNSDIEHKFIQVGSLPNWLNGAPLIKVDMDNTFKLLLIGGRTHSAMFGHVYVGTCDDCKENWIWNISNEMMLPVEMGYFGCVFVEYMKTIIIFGGKTEENYLCNQDDIYYLELDKKPLKWIISTVKCVIKDNFYAVSAENMVEQILLNGFVRDVLNNVFIPDSILQLIGIFAKQCEIHLFQRGNGHGHWTIDVNALLIPSVRNEVKGVHNTSNSSRLISELFGV